MTDCCFENPRYASHYISDEKSLPFSKREYSLFKHGVTTQIKTFSAQMVPVCLNRILDDDRIRKVIVYSSPYDYLPTPSLLLAREYISQLTSATQKHKSISIHEGKINRNHTYTENYAKLSRSNRLKLISNDTYNLDIVPQNEDFLIFIDDISVTGTHQFVIESLLKEQRIVNDKIFLYYIAVDTALNPEIENELNESAITDINSIVEIINQQDFVLVTRIVKRILAMNEDDLNLILRSKKKNAKSFWREFIYKSMRNKYQHIPEYQRNIRKITSVLADMMNTAHVLFIVCFIWILGACNARVEQVENIQHDSVGAVASKSNTESEMDKEIGILGTANTIKRTVVRLGHHVNTAASEYYPLLVPDQSALVFSGMDRTGYFDFKLDFTKSRSSGGEDIFVSEFTNGVLADARPVESLNTNGHECANLIFPNGDLLVTANYSEKLGPQSSDKGLETTDIFLARKKSDGYQIMHLPEPVNSIFTEADAFCDERLSFMLFVSDRPGHVGEYHKKGWRWNENLWGNTDVYVCLQEGDEWQAAINLGPIVNTAHAERTPWLSPDGLTLYLSSNGHREGRNDLDIYCFKRQNRNDWTNWSGPYDLTDVNSEMDDWCYKEYQDGRSVFARARSKSFKTTQEGVNGDGYIRETNFRSGYQVLGAQSAALSKDENTDIFLCLPEAKAAFILPDILFKFDSYQITPEAKITFDRLLDLCNENRDKKVLFVGHTDNSGTDEYNYQLSLKRSQAVMNYLLGAGLKNEREAIGKGKSCPLVSNNGESNRKKNRRVEVYFE